MLNLYLKIINWLKSEEGQDLAEYALLLGIMVLGGALVWTALRGRFRLG